MLRYKYKYLNIEEYSSYIQTLDPDLPIKIKILLKASLTIWKHFVCEYISNGRQREQMKLGLKAKLSQPKKCHCLKAEDQHAHTVFTSIALKDLTKAIFSLFKTSIL